MVPGPRRPSAGVPRRVIPGSRKVVVSISSGGGSAASDAPPALQPRQAHARPAAAGGGGSSGVVARGSAANTLRMLRRPHAGAAPPSVDKQGLLERCVGLGDYEGLLRLLDIPEDNSGLHTVSPLRRPPVDGGTRTAPRYRPPHALEADAVLIMAVNRQHPRSLDILRTLLAHPSATYEGCAAMLEHVLATGVGCVQCLIAEACTAAFPGVMGLLSKAVVTRTFQTEGVSKRQDLFNPSLGYRLAYLLLSDGAPRPPSAFFPPPRHLRPDELEGADDPDFPPGHETRLQLVYLRARQRMNHRLLVLLYYIRDRTAGWERGGLDLCLDLVEAVTQYVPYGHASLYPAGTKQVKLD